MEDAQSMSKHARDRRTKGGALYLRLQALLPSGFLIEEQRLLFGADSYVDQQTHHHTSARSSMPLFN